MCFDNFCKKLFGPKERYVMDSTKNIREIVSSYYRSKTVYAVNFIEEQHYTIYRDDVKVDEHVETYSFPSVIRFTTVKGAEAYAKNFCKCETVSFNKEFYVYPNGYENVKKYGNFILDDHCSDPLIYDFEIFEPKTHYDHSYLIQFKFNKLYEEKYGEFYEVNRFDLFNGNDVISSLVNYINGYGNVIKRFDVNTLESLPINKLKATSEELKELKIILDEYYERQDRYIKLIETINKR